MTLRLTPYLVMDGNANEAIHFYEEVMDAKVAFRMTFGEMPGNPGSPLADDVKERIAHALLKIGESELMISDRFPGHPHQSGDQVTICIATGDADQSKAVYEALKQDGRVNMPLQETFFSPAYGIVTDKFGVTFQINTEISR